MGTTRARWICSPRTISRTIIEAYQQGKAQPLDFGIGYMFQPERTCLMVARPGAGSVSQR